MLAFPLSWSKHVIGLWKLTRILPVIAWGGGAVMLGAALSLAERSVFFRWPELMATILGVLLLQGIAGHAFNDCEDWRSGTDKNSPGILSGGSGVIKLNLLSCTQLQQLGKISIVAALCLTVYLSLSSGPLVLVFPAIGIWAALAYTCPPMRLAYKPLLGEWLAAWPAMLACTTGTSFILTGSISNLTWWAGFIHATLSVAWLMQHHIPDITADLAALPPKCTTVAYVRQRWGWKYVTIPVAVYFGVVIIAAIPASTVHPGFMLSIAAGMLGMYLALATTPQDVQNVTQKQIRMVFVSILHFCLLSLSFLVFGT